MITWLRKVLGMNFGEVVVVKNTFKYRTANDEYWAIKVRMPNGDEQFWLMTEDEMDTAFDRACKNSEDIPKELL